MKWSLVISFWVSSINAFPQHNFRPAPEVAAKLAIRNEEREGLIPKTYTFSKEDENVIDRCNTAKKSFYHNKEEREFILLMNLARVDKEVLYKYITHRYDPLFISKLPIIPANERRLILKSSHGLHLSAKVHAKKSGRNATVGHQNLNRRIRMFNFYFKRYPIYGENCSYNDTNHPLVHFIQLMNSKPHFINIMDVEFNAVGISFKKHVKYGMNGVTCFGFNQLKLSRDF